MTSTALFEVDGALAGRGDGGDLPTTLGFVEAVVASIHPIQPTATAA